MIGWSVVGTALGVVVSDGRGPVLGCKHRFEAKIGKESCQILYNKLLHNFSYFSYLHVLVSDHRF